MATCRRSLRKTVDVLNALDAMASDFEESDDDCLPKDAACSDDDLDESDDCNDINSTVSAGSDSDSSDSADLLDTLYRLASSETSNTDVEPESDDNDSCTDIDSTCDEEEWFKNPIQVPQTDFDAFPVLPSQA